MGSYGNISLNIPQTPSMPTHSVRVLVPGNKSSNGQIINVLTQVQKDWESGMETQNLDKIISAAFHVIGPTGLQSSSLEGMNRREAADQLSQYLQKFIVEETTLTEHQKEKLGSLLTTLDEAIVSSVSMPLTEEVKKVFKQKFLEELDKNGRFLFLGGYITTSEVDKSIHGGHAIIYEVFKEKDGSYTFVINNTGRGIEKHKIKGNKVHTILYTGLSLNTFNDNFWGKLLDYRSQGTNVENSVNNIYQHIDVSLNCGDNKKDGRLLKYQRAGVCAWKGLSTWLHGKIAPGEKQLDRNKDDELLYLKFMRFVLSKKKVELKGMENVFTSKNVIINKTNRVSKLFKEMFGQKYKPKEYKDREAAKLLDDELDNKIARIDKKIKSLGKKTGFRIGWPKFFKTFSNLANPSNYTQLNE